MDEYGEKILERKQKQKEVIDQLLSNTNYVNWLINFTKDKEMFFDSDWDYSNDKLNDADQEKVNYLSLFFEGIFSYARQNSIDSLFRALGEYYQIKVNDIGLEIGYITGQGTSFYCKLIPVSGEDFIDFHDIINYRNQTKQGKVYYKKKY